MNVLVLDGYNVIARGMAKDPQREFGSDDARREYRRSLVRLAERYASGRKALEVRIYFDGSSERVAPELSSRRVKVFFAKGTGGADREIIQFCRNHPRPSEIEVATDDHNTLSFYIRSSVGRVLSVAEVMRRLDRGYRPAASGITAHAVDRDEKKQPLSESEKKAINQTLPGHWFRE